MQVKAHSASKGPLPLPAPSTRERQAQCERLLSSVLSRAHPQEQQIERSGNARTAIAGDISLAPNQPKPNATKMTAAAALPRQ
jgi:hypothetical protein